MVRDHRALCALPSAANVGNAYSRGLELETIPEEKAPEEGRDARFGIVDEQPGCGLEESDLVHLHQGLKPVEQGVRAHPPLDGIPVHEEVAERYRGVPPPEELLHDAMERQRVQCGG